MNNLAQVAEFSLRTGWSGLLAGVISGAWIGLYFHQTDWLGGYGSFRRRLTRLGHIAFFGLGFVNIFFGLSLEYSHLPVPSATICAWMLAAGLVLMPLCCFLSAWREPFRHAFPLPVTAVGGGILLFLLQWGKG